MAAKQTKAQLAAAKAVDAAPGQTLEEGATAPASKASGAPGGESGVGAAPGGAGESDNGDGGTGSADDAGEGNSIATTGDGSSGEGAAAGGVTDAAPGQAQGEGTPAPGTKDSGASGGEPGEAGGVPGDQPNAGDGASAGDAGATGTDADALATDAAESTLAAFEGAAKDLGGLDPQGAAAVTMAALLAEETTQTDDETDSAEPVIWNVWAMPEIWEFPALLTLSNNTASRFSVKSVNRSIQAHESITAEFDRRQYENLKRSLAGPARLDKWDSLYGVQVKHESDRSESND